MVMRPEASLDDGLGQGVVTPVALESGHSLAVRQLGVKFKEGHEIGHHGYVHEDPTSHNAIGAGRVFDQGALFSPFAKTQHEN